MRTEFLCISVLRVASGPRVKLASCKSALTPPPPPPAVVCSTDRSKAVVPVLVLLFVALWFILRGDLLYVCPCVILFLCFSVFLVLRLARLGKTNTGTTALERSVSSLTTDCVKCFGKADKGHVEVHILFLAFFLKLSCCEVHVYCSSVFPESTMAFW